VSNEILAGVRVLDFTTIVSGPFCTRLLADLGAEVIKLEPPEGDFIRVQPPLRDGKSAYFAHLNCGKKSVAIDLRQPEATDLVRELAAKCDVVVENSRPGVMQRLGLDYPALANLNPAVVYCSISGFGQQGSWARRSAYAPILHAASGFDLVNLSYQEGLDRPLRTGIFVGDVLGGTYAFGAIQSALLQRERTGRGDCIDLSMMDAMLGMLIFEFQEAQFPIGRRVHTFQPTRAKDGFIMIAQVKPNNFEALARGVGLVEWAASRTTRECEAILNEAGVPCSRYFTVREAMAQPHLAERGSFAVIDDGAGPLKVPNPPFKFSQSAAAARDYVPALGEDNARVLSTVLGYSPARIEELYRKRILRGTDGNRREPRGDAPGADEGS
jgi:CoA:oxalate CoA-transferase